MPHYINDFSFRTNGQKHPFSAPSRDERNEWNSALETSSTKAKGARKGLIASEGYKSQQEKPFHDGTLPADSVAVAGPTYSTAAVAPSITINTTMRGFEAGKLKRKSCSLSYWRVNIFGLLGKKEEYGENKDAAPIGSLLSSATPTVHFSENVLATSGKLEASSCVFYQIISCSDLPAGYQMAHTSATPVHISSFAYSTSDVVSHTHTSVTPARISSSAYSTSDIVSYAQTSANPAHVSSSAPQRHDFVATDLIFRLLVFSLLAAPRDAKAIRLEEEPEIVQTLFHWSGEFILMWAVLTLFNLIVAIMGWPQAQRNGREADQEGGQSREVKEGSGTAGMEEENIESGPAEDCLNDGP